MIGARRMRLAASLFAFATAGAGAFELPAVPPAPVPAEEARPPIQADRILFRGNRAIALEELDAIAGPYRGRRLGPADIEELRRKVTQHYVDRGYVSSGALVAPETSERTLVIEIVEGRLAAIRLRGLDGLDERYVAGRLASDRDGAFNVDRLRERFQLLLADPLFARMNARLMPGGRPGESILDIDVVRSRPYQLTLYANNYRPPSIGAETTGARGWMRNLTGQGDVVEATLEGPRRQENVTRWSLAGRMPLGATGTAVSAQCDRGRSAVVEEPLAAIGIRSILESCEAGVTHTLRETLRNRWAAGLSHVRRTNRTFLLGEPFSFVPGEPDGVTRARSWRLSNEFTHRSETDVVALRALATRVRNNVQDEGFLSVALPDRRYLVWLGQAQYVRHLFEGATRISVRATVQQTKSRLLPFDALPIGGANTVRGYRENQFIRENARILNVEVEHTVWRDSGDGAQFSIAPFVDYGRGSGHDTSSIALSSAGLVVRGRWRGFSASIAVARKLSHPPLPTAGRRDLQDHGMHLEIAYVVF